MFVALDADAQAMADASRRAARPPRKGGRPNVIFLAAAAEALPGALFCFADEATVILPWGSLLVAVLDPPSATLAGIIGCLKESGRLTVLVSAQERDRIGGGELDGDAILDVADAHRSAGYFVEELRLATRADVELLSSGWGRRLRIPDEREAWLLRITRDREFRAGATGPGDSDPSY